jgi:hypothetical protein
LLSGHAIWHSNYHDEQDGQGMTDEDIKARLVELMQEHRDMDSAIAALTGQNAFDQLQVQRLKKRKLQLKDAIQKLEDLLLPDIIA